MIGRKGVRNLSRAPFHFPTLLTPKKLFLVPKNGTTPRYLYTRKSNY